MRAKPILSALVAAALGAGCTAIPMIPATHADDWTVGLPRYLSVARACLDAAPIDERQVVAAWPLGGGKAAARILYPDGRRLDCVAQGLPLEGGEDDAALVRVASLEPATGSARPGEGRTIFTLLDEGPPGGNPCHEHERVEDPQSGVAVGFLSRDTCPPQGQGRRLW